MLSILPVDLTAFGQNPYGKNIWRVVWGPSRKYKAWHKSDLGSLSEHELPMYPGTNAWILERWLPAIKYAGTEAGWEAQEATNEIKLGPYPSQGEWCGCSEIWSDIPGQMQVIQAIQHVRAGDNFSFEENLKANMDVHEAQEKAWLNRAEDIFHDSQGAFNNKPTNINPAKKTPDKVRLGHVDPKSLPKGDGKFFQS